MEVILLSVVINQGTSLYDFDQIQMDFSLTEKCGQQNYFKDYSTSAQEIPRSNFLLFVCWFLCLKHKNLLLSIWSSNLKNRTIHYIINTWNSIVSAIYSSKFDNYIYIILQIFNEEKWSIEINRVCFCLRNYDGSQHKNKKTFILFAVRKKVKVKI